MEKNTKTYKDVFNFMANANRYLSINKDETKLKYAIERVGKANEVVTSSYHQKVADLNLEHAFTDDKGRVPFTTNEQGVRTYEYTKDGLKSLDKAIEDLFNSEVEVSVYYATEMPEDYNEQWDIAFKGFVIF
jgi:hypothetical protein